MTKLVVKEVSRDGGMILFGCKILYGAPATSDQFFISSNNKLNGILSGFKLYYDGEERSKVHSVDEIVVAAPDFKIRTAVKPGHLFLDPEARQKEKIMNWG